MKKGEMFGVMECVFPSHSDVWWSPVFLGMDGWTPACHGSNIYWYIYTFVSILYLLNFPYLNPWVFSFFFSSSLPHSLWGEWVRGLLNCQVGLNYDTIQSNSASKFVSKLKLVTMTVLSNSLIVSTSVHP